MLLTRVLVVAALVLPATVARAGEPTQEARQGLATALDQARAEHWQEAAATLDAVIAASPEWGEAYYVRAGVLTFLAGDAALASRLAVLDESTDYVALGELLDRAVADLDRFLALAPDAPERTRVTAARDALTARAVEARANAGAIAARRATGADQVAAPLAITDLARRREVRIGYGLSQIEQGPDPALTIHAFDLAGAVMVGRRLHVHAGLTGTTAALGSLRAGATVLHDLGGLRLGARITAALALAEPDDATVLALHQGARAPLDLAGSNGAEVAVTARTSLGGAVVAVEVAGAVTEEDLGGRVTVGASRGLVDVADHAVAAQASFVTSFADGAPWIGDQTFVHEVLVGASWWYGGIAAGIPLDGPVADARGITLLASVSVPF